MFFSKANKWGLLFLTAWAYVFPAAAQRTASYTAKVSYDSTAVAELFTTIPVGVTFHFPDGSGAATRGFLNGRIRWKDIHIATDQGIIRRGKLIYDRDKVWKNHHQVTFQIRIDDTTLACNLSLPYVQSLRFNLYTDSLKRDNPFYLNVEGRFSSGRVYPLDTGMVAFEKAGGGTLEGNVLTVTSEQTNVKMIKVYTWLKADPMMRDSVTIPVKILPDPSTLPSEQQLLDQWKKRKH